MNELVKSSATPEKLSLTVKGVMMSMVPIIIGVFQILSIPISEAQIIEIIQAVTAAIAGLTMLVGMLRKVWYSLKK